MPRLLAPGTVLLAFLAGLGLSAPRAVAATWDVPATVATLAAALDSAVAGDTVLVACGTYLEHDLVLKSGVTLRSAGGDPGCVTIDAQQAGRVLDGSGLDASTRLEGLTITGGIATSGPFLENAGGGLRAVDSALEITSCRFEGNKARYGGGIALQGGEATLTDVEFFQNTTESEFWAAGGGLYALGGEPVLRHCSFEGNVATATGTPGDGGAVFADGTRMLVFDSSFRFNVADAGAGGFYSYSADRSGLTRCVFEGNEAGAGGAMYLETSFSRFASCDFLGNTAVNGGALFLAANSLPEFEDCRLVGNTSTPNSGGAVEGWSSTPRFERCEFSDNVSDLRGGALNLNFGSSVTLVDCVLARNRAAGDGGAMRISGNAVVDVTGSTLVANEAGGAGGGAFLMDSAALDLSRCLVAHSVAGAAVTCLGGAVATLTCTDVWGNAGGDWTGCLSGQESQSGNLAVDPLLCDVADSAYGLRFPDSPLLPANNSCGERIGATDVGCGCPATATRFVPGDHPTIAAALAASQAGDVIGVCDGVWEEALDLRNGVHVVGVRPDLAVVRWPLGGPADALVRANGLADSTVISGLGLDAFGGAEFVLAADSATVGLHVLGNRITGGATGGVRVGPDSRIVLGGDLGAANDLAGNGGGVPLHLRNENVGADSLEARFNWWGTTNYWGEIVPAIEGPVRSCPITDSTHTSVLCAPASAVAAPEPQPAGGRGVGLAVGPNPFRLRTEIVLTLPEPTPAHLSIHDVRGRRVAGWRRGSLPAGRHALGWDGRESSGRPAAAGVYFLRLETGSGVNTLKMVKLP